MNLSLPTKTIISALAIIVSFVFTNGAQAGRPLIHSESACKEVADYYGKSYGGTLTWGGTGNYKTKGCYYYEKGKYAGTVWYGTGGVVWSQNANTGDGKKSTGKRRFDALCHKNTTYRHVREGGGVKSITLNPYPRRAIQKETAKYNMGRDELTIYCNCSEKEMVQGSIGNVSGKCSHSPRGRRY